MDKKNTKPSFTADVFRKSLNNALTEFSNDLTEFSGGLPIEEKMTVIIKDTLNAPFNDFKKSY
jgi:hypothetical protein